MSPIKSKIYNFYKFVFDLVVEAFLQENTILTCNCAGSGFIDKDHRNIDWGLTDC